jgi:N-acetylglucosaminyldiphosphoundecaprenol N-acetyl-beta-D-mannosaminyltransferase
MERAERVRVLGVPVDIVDRWGAVELIEKSIRKGNSRNYILAVNAEKINSLQYDPILRDVFDNAALLLPDGIGTVLAVNFLYGLRIQRVPSADLMQHICRQAAKKGYRVFIYGAKEEVNKRAVEKLSHTYPEINIVGRSHGYISEEKMNDLVSKINDSQADILFVSLGSPKQERWIQKYLPSLDVKICQGIGGTLDVISGNTKRAPSRLQKLGLEFVYRLIHEPKRFRRYIVFPGIALKVIKEKLRQY